jgi:hypothetical protein
LAAVILSNNFPRQTKEQAEAENRAAAKRALRILRQPHFVQSMYLKGVFCSFVINQKFAGPCNLLDYGGLRW